MRIILPFLLLLSPYAMGIDYQSDSNIDCFKNARSVNKAAYTIEPVGPYDANLLYPKQAALVVEGFEEQRQDDPDFF